MTVWIEKAIHFVLQHNEVMVQTMLVLVVAWGALILGTWVLGKGEDSSPSTGKGANPSQSIHGPDVAVAAVSGGGAVSLAAAAEAAAQVSKLQQELTTRAQEVEALKAKISETPAAEPVDISGYVKKIKDLEGKLSEYEILEDDIADLSLYKEENVRLKAEITRLGGEPGQPVEAAPVSVESPAPQAVAAPPAVAQETPQAEAPAAAVAAAVPEKADALVDQFATAVEQNKPVESKDGDDLLTEFAASISDSTDAGGGEESVDLDTEKMMAEMASLEGIKDDGTALDGEADIDKMAAEANKLLGS